MKENRPKIRVSPSRLAILLEVGAWVLVLALIVWVSMEMGKLPDKIPVHFGADGLPNRWGSPSELWILVGVSVFVVGLLAIVRRVVEPYNMNIPVHVTPENAPKVYRLTLDLLCVLQFVIAITFLLLFFTTIQNTHQPFNEQYNQRVLITILSLIFGTVGFYFIKIVSVK